MVKLLHTADLHLDSPFSGLTPEEALRRRRLQRQIPMALAERCRAEGCGLWLEAGDVFDGGRLAPETVEALQAAWEHCAVPVLVAPGNHDPYTSDSPWARVKWPGNVHVFSGPWEAVELESLGCRIWGAAFQGREARGLLGAAAAERGFWEIGVLHGEVAATGAYNPMTEGDIAASGLNYLALGHVHRPLLPRRAGKTWYGWPGVTLGRGFDETGSHGVLLVELAGSDCRSQLLPLPGPQYRVVSVAAGENPLAAAEAALPADWGEDYVRLVFTGEAEGVDCEAAAAALAGRCRNLTVVDQTTPRRDLWADAGDGSLRGLALQRLQAAHAAGETAAELAARYLIAALEGRDGPWS